MFLADILCPNVEISQNFGADADMDLPVVYIAVHPAELSVFTDLL